MPMRMSKSERALAADLAVAERRERAAQAECAGCGHAIEAGQAIQWRRVGESYRWHRFCLPADVQALLATQVWN